MKKNLYRAVIFIGLVLSSCNISRDAAYLNSQKLQAKQELVNQNNKQQPVLSQEQNQLAVTAPSQRKVSDTLSMASETRKATVVKPSLHKSMQSVAKRKFVNKTGLALTQMLTLPKISNNVNNLLKNQIYTAKIGQAHLSDDDYKRLWIMLLAISLICFILAFIFYLLFLSLIEEIFDLLGILAAIPALLFLILWLIDMV